MHGTVAYPISREDDAVDAVNTHEKLSGMSGPCCTGPAFGDSPECLASTPLPATPAAAATPAVCSTTGSVDAEAALVHDGTSVPVPQSRRPYTRPSRLANTSVPSSLRVTEASVYGRLSRSLCAQVVARGNARDHRFAPVEVLKATRTCTRLEGDAASWKRVKTT
jgi:hypothetical protein